MQRNKFLDAMILTELEDAVGRENCSSRPILIITSFDPPWYRPPNGVTA